MYGEHYDIGSKKLTDVLEKIPYNSVQIFTQTPRRAYSKTRHTDYEEYAKIIKSRKLNVIVHCTYPVTAVKLRIDKESPTKYQNVFKSVLQDTMFCKLIGGYGYVLHTGYKKTEKDEDFNLKEISGYVRKLSENTTMLLEHNVIGLSLESIKSIINVNPEKIGFCMDTAHLWGTGIDIESAFKKYKKNIKLIHLNNSPAEFGSGIDRHISLSKGLIPTKTIDYVIKFGKKQKIPIILETKPLDDRPKDLYYLSEFFK